jgi:hypothetical protein
VPGHGDVQSKAMVQAWFANAEAKRAKIQELVKQGKSLDEVRAAVDPPPAAGRRRWTRGRIRQLHSGGLYRTDEAVTARAPGMSQPVRRTSLGRLTKEARARRFNTVLVWILDRWGRSMVDSIACSSTS